MAAELITFISDLPLSLLILLCLTIGLAPFNPPHIWEKLQLLTRGELVKPLDWFDLALHGSPCLLLIFKIILIFTGSNKTA